MISLTHLPVMPVTLHGPIGAAVVSLALLALLSVRISRRRQAVAVRLAAHVTPHRTVRAAARTRASSAAMFSGELPAWIDRVLAVAGIRRDEADRHLMRWPFAVVIGLVLARLVAGVLTILVGDVALLSVPLLWIAGLRFFFGFCRERHLGKLYQQFPDALSMIVRAVRVGIPVSESLRTVARDGPEPTASAFAAMADRVAMGVSVGEALRDVAEKSGLPEYRFFATALSLQSQTGGALSETLDNLAEVIRGRVALRARAHALSSEARASATVLMALPIVAMGALEVLSPAYINVLFTDPGGQKILIAAVLLLVGGALVMRSIIRRSLR
jgi:tight adherence protein B